MTAERIEIAGQGALLWGKPAQRAFLYVHGKNGSAAEAERFASLAEGFGWQTVSFDLPGHGLRCDEPERFVPWEVCGEIGRVHRAMTERWQEIGLYAVSIGAYFSLRALQKRELAQALLVSPVTDMEALIERMMEWAGVSETQLHQAGIIPTGFGETLSWGYLENVRSRPVTRWQTPTRILFGSEDALLKREWAEDFARRFGCALTVADGAEHWFHTPEQLAVLREWEEKQLRKQG